MNKRSAKDKKLPRKRVKSNGLKQIAKRHQRVKVEPTEKKPCLSRYWDRTVERDPDKSINPKGGAFFALFEAPRARPVTCVPVTSNPDAVPVSAYPAFAKVFPFTHFNRMQSHSLNPIYHSNANCVVTSPTGSGKTVLFELAILRLFATRASAAKAVYIAPTKALCSERARDWSLRFKGLKLAVGSLTSDTPPAENDRVWKCQVIVTTPEKWDLLTRRWAEKASLIRQVSLVLLDEVHCLGSTRGAILEVVVTRMLALCPTIRVVALSATISNPQSIALWLTSGVVPPAGPIIEKATKSLLPNVDALTMVMEYGEAFRAVRVNKVVVGFPARGNEYQFDTMLNQRLGGLLQKYSRSKPLLIFCPTRGSCESTCKSLEAGLQARCEGTAQFENGDLTNLTKKGIAFHHAGLCLSDRVAVEQAFIRGEITLLCCTSTLAVGVNLPAFLVVIKGTRAWSKGSFEEYTATDIIQMTGRAGRPQFESEGCAVILTENATVGRYRDLRMGTETVESCLHLNLFEPLVSEVALGNIASEGDLERWLRQTFLYKRYVTNPTGYPEIPLRGEANPEQALFLYCRKTLIELCEARMLINHLPEGAADPQNEHKGDTRYRATVYGHAMVRHYLRFSTMCHFVDCAIHQSPHTLIQTLSEASEWETVRLKHHERKLYRTLNDHPSIRFRVTNPKRWETPQKVSLLLQLTLGNTPFSTEPGASKLRQVFFADRASALRLAPRLLRGLAEVFVAAQDAHSLLHLMALARSLSAKAWEPEPCSPLTKNTDGEPHLAFTQTSRLGSVSPPESDFGERGAHGGFHNQSEDYPGLMTGAPHLLVRLSAAMPSGPWDSLTSARMVEIAVVARCKSGASATKKQQRVFATLLTESSCGFLIDYRRLTFYNPSYKQFTLCVDSQRYPTITTHINCEEITGVGTSFQLTFPRADGMGMAESEVSDDDWDLALLLAPLSKDLGT